MDVAYDKSLYVFFNFSRTEGMPLCIFFFFFFFFFFCRQKNNVWTQLFQDLLADFLQIKFMNTYGYVDVINIMIFNFGPFCLKNVRGCIGHSLL